MFREKHPARFNFPRRKVTCQKLAVDGELITEKKALLKCWKDHFENLTKSRSKNSESISSLHARSHCYNDGTLDTPFSIEEIEHAVKKLKIGKGCGADKLQAEHLKYGGHIVLLWLQRIFNTIIQLEGIPPCLKLGITVPIFKGKGRDPLNQDNYRGITLTSVVTKCLEICVCERLSPVLMERGFPNQAQTAYRKGISCADAIFSTQETLLKYTREGENPIMCCFDLEKAFDSIEYDVLLNLISA